MFDKKVLKKIGIILFLIILIVFLVMFIRKTFSRYETVGTSETDVPIAFFVVTDTNTESNVFVENMLPGDTKEFAFSVTNNKDGKRAEVTLDYEVSVKATTNMPLKYEFYRVEGETKEKINDITEVNEADGDGTYFKTVTAPSLLFKHTEDQTHNYVLKIIFPEDNNKAEYADLVENVNLRVSAKQKFDDE